jgi:hypothetical protein
MATKPRNTTTARTKKKTGGKPATTGGVRAKAAKRGPSAEELDARDRLKSGPRRQAGPPLGGDTLDRAAMKALQAEVVPEVTDPKNRRSRK